MRSRFVRFLVRWLIRLLCAGLAFSVGWVACVQGHPAPLLRERWAALVRASESAPDSGGTSLAGNRAARSDRTPAFDLEALLHMRDPVGQSAALADALKSASADDCRDWLAVVETMPGNPIRGHAVNAILARWAEIDPAGALAATGALDENSIPMTVSRSRQISGAGGLAPDFKAATVLRHWAHRDPAAAFAAAGGEWHDAIRQGIMESDPDHALARWKEIAPDETFPLPMLEFSLRSLVQRDPLAAVSQVPPDDDYQTNSIRRDLFSQWLDKDSAAALAWLSTQRDAHVRSQLYGEYAARHPDEMEARLSSLPEAERPAAALVIARGKAAADPVAAAQWLQSMVSPADFEAAFIEISNAGFGMQPEALAAFMQMAPNAEARAELFTRGTNGPARGAAFAWLKAQPPETLTPAMLETAFSRGKPEEVSFLIPTVNTLTPEVVAKLGSGLGPALLLPDFATAGNRIAALPPVLQNAATAALLDAPIPFVAFESGEYTNARGPVTADETAAIFATLPPDAQARNALAFAAKQSASPVLAAQSLAALPEPDTHPAAAAVYESVAATWMNSDPTAASTWIQSLPPGTSRDAAVVALIGTAAGSDPDTAAAWAATLTDPVALLRARQLLTPSAP